MRVPATSLDATYRVRAVPAGTLRYCSWLFAAPETKAPLLGIFALLAEWQALADPATETGVAHLKLAWWRDEMQRLAAGSGVHPISVYLTAVPRFRHTDSSALLAAVDATAAQVGGAPWERSADLERQAAALWGGPLLLASHLAGDFDDDTRLSNCVRALAAAEYLAKALGDYRREARQGRVVFAIDELLFAGIDNGDLTAEVAPARLQTYLGQLTARAAGYFAVASTSLPPAQRARHRHLLVLAALGAKHLEALAHPRPRRVRDMLLAWQTARQAAAAPKHLTSEFSQ